MASLGSKTLLALVGFPMLDICVWTEVANWLAHSFYMREGLWNECRFLTVFDHHPEVTLWGWQDVKFQPLTTYLQTSAGKQMWLQAQTFVVIFFTCQSVRDLSQTTPKFNNARKKEDKDKIKTLRNKSLLFPCDDYVVMMMQICIVTPKSMLEKHGLKH